MDLDGETHLHLDFISLCVCHTFDVLLVILDMIDESLFFFSLDLI